MNLQNYPEIMNRVEVGEVLRLGRYKMNELIFGGKIKVLIIGFGNIIWVRHFFWGLSQAL